MWSTRTPANPSWSASSRGTVSTAGDDVGVLDPHGDEIVDGEEAAHVALGLLPVLQAVVLPSDRLGRRQARRAVGEREPLRAEAQLAVDDLQ